MKVFLNSNFEIENISNESGDPIVRGSDKFNKLHIFVPTSTVNSYNTISPLYSVKRADGRILGNYATITTHDNTEAFNGYYGWKGDFNPRDIAVAGALELTISFKMKKTAASVEMTKTVAKITLEVKEAAVVLDDVLVLGDGGAWISLSESIAALTTNLGAKADLNNSQQSIVAGLVKSTSFKKGDAELATEAQVSEEATARQQADNALQTDINTRVKIADIINALNDTSTNKPLSAYQGKLLKDAIDGINALLQSNDTDLDELQEIVTYIKNNKTLIDGITSSKISYTDIVDNLTSELANKPLSAKQGYILKGLIDTLETAVNNRYTKSETDTLLNGKADKSTTYTKTQVNNLLSGKQGITIPAITIAGVEYTNLEAAISAINDYAETIEQVIGSISGTDSTIATRLTQLENSVQSLNSAWTTFTTGTSADNIINTLVEIQNKFKEFNIIYLPDNATSGHLSNNTVNKITSRTLVVYEGKVFTLSEIGDDYYCFSSNSGDDLNCNLAYLYIENNPNNDEEQNYHIDFVNGEIKRNKVTSWSQNPSNENYPSEKLVKDSLDSETTRATSQENKSLYHLGAFDSADGKTRQTGVIDLSKLSWQYQSTAGCWYAENVIPNATECVATNYTCYNNRAYSALVNGELTTNNTAWGAIDTIIIKDSQSNYPKGILQYKLATSYQDTPIEGESILPLDSNMAQMIRQDVVEGLNLFSGLQNLKINTSTGAITQNSEYLGTQLIKVMPNTTYYLNDIPTPTNNCIFYYQSNGTYIDRTGGEAISYRTFTTPSDCYYVAFGLVNSLTSSQISEALSHNIMLNEGSHAYPPSDYHARKHITDEEATLLKKETVKCRNLLDPNKLNFSSSYYTLTQNNGLFTLVSNGNGNTAFGSFENIYLEKGKTYTISKQNITYDTDGIGLYFEEGGTRYYSQFTPSSSGYYVLYLRLQLTYSGTITFNIMLNEGSEAQPYSEHYGELVHKADIEPTLLWENANPNDNQSTISASLSQSINNFKYIVVEWTLSNYILSTDQWGGQTTKFKVRGTSNNRVMISSVDGSSYRCKPLQFNGTSLTISNEYVNGAEQTSGSTHLIIQTIYGTNIL